MAHFAQIDNTGIVIQVIVVNNDVLNNADFPDSEAIGIEFCRSLFGLDTNWKQTSYSGSFRKKFAGKGFVYDVLLDAFLSPQPYPSWTLVKETAEWEPPVSIPKDGKPYRWDEQSLSWILIEQDAL